MKWHVFAMLVSVVVALIGLAVIGSQTTPDTAGTLIRSLFFITLFIAVWGMVSLISLWIRYRFGSQPISVQLIKSAALYGLAFAGIVIATMLINRFV